MPSHEIAMQYWSELGQRMPSLLMSVGTCLLALQLQLAAQQASRTGQCIGFMWLFQTGGAQGRISTAICRARTYLISAAIRMS